MASRNFCSCFDFFFDGGTFARKPFKCICDGNQLAKSLNIPSSCHSLTVKQLGIYCSSQTSVKVLRNFPCMLRFQYIAKCMAEYRFSMIKGIYNALTHFNRNIIWTGRNSSGWILERSLSFVPFHQRAKLSLCQICRNQFHELLATIGACGRCLSDLYAKRIIYCI